MEKSNKNIQDELLASLFSSSSSSSTTAVRPFSEVIAPYLDNWKWLLLSIPLCLAIGVFKVMTTEQQFKSTETIIINQNDNKNSSGSNGLSLDDMGLLSSNTNIDNEVVILSSPDLMREVVDTLNLATKYYIKENFRDKELFTYSPFVATYSKKNTDFPGKIQFTVIRHENNRYEVKGQYALTDNNLVTIDRSTASLPLRITFPDSLGSVLLEATGKPITPETDYKITISSPYDLAQGLSGALSVTQTNKNATALNIAISVNNVNKGNAIIKELVHQYNLLNTKANNEISYNTALFINERLKEISGELGDVENDMVDYKQQNKIADLPSEAQQSIQQSGQNYQKLLDAETQLKVINMVSSYVKDPANKLKVIPNLGVSDPALAAVISDYNTKIIGSEMLLKNTGEDNPTRVKVAAELSSMHATIVSSLKNVQHAYEMNRDDAQQLYNTSNSQIYAIPQHEKGMLERSRQQEIKENLFLFLMQKREETNISIASISEKARIVVMPKKNGVLVAPNAKMILLAALLIGFLIPVVLTYLLNLLQTEIADRRQLEKLSEINIIGQIPSSANFLAMVSDPSGSVAEMFRTLRNRLKFVFRNRTKRTILVTSSMKGEGKTFVSVNLAITYAMGGMKVLLIGGDIRQPRLKKALNLTATEGLSDYLAYQSDDWHDYITQSSCFPELDILVSGTVSPNPNELLLSDRLKVLMEEVKNEYDTVILDSAPVGMVSDTYLFSEWVDATLYVVRERLTPKSSIPFINSQKQDGLLKNLYLVLNDCKMSKNNGYKYGYGKEYGYKPVNSEE